MADAAPSDDMAMADLPEAASPPVTLGEAIAMIDRQFGVEKLLGDAGKQVVEPYYRQSVLVYEQFYEKHLSVPGCMHFGLDHDGRFTRRGFYEQARAIRKLIRKMGTVRQVLEVGCGKGVNTIRVAGACPEVSFTGLDLLSDHVEKATARSADLPNARFVQGSFEPIPASLSGADVIFGVETLCYAKDLDAVCQSIADSLNPGGRLVIFDCFREDDKGPVSDQMRLATRLLEVGWGVPAGYRSAAEWCAALERAGLRMHWVKDETANALPSVTKLQGFAMRFFGDWKLRMQSRILPELGRRNAVTAILMPLLFQGQPGNGPDATAPGVSYMRLVARKPG